MKELLLALGAKPGSEPKDEAVDVEAPADEDMGSDEGYKAAAAEVMDAFKSGDSTVLADALKSFIDLCK